MAAAYSMAKSGGRPTVFGLPFAFCQQKEECWAGLSSSIMSVLARGSPQRHSVIGCTDKNKIKFSSYIKSGAVSKSYMRKGFLIYEEMRK